MGLLDKVKNLFTDEEIIDDEDDTISVHEIKKENKKSKKEKNEDKLPTFMREKIIEEEGIQQPDFTLSKDSSIEPENIINNNMIDNKDVSNSVEKNIDENIVRENKQPRESFKFPMDFSDDDFVETRARRSRKNIENENVIPNMEPVNKTVKKEEVKPRVKDLYKDKVVEPKKEEKRFRATPIISPVYGVLDKNYQTSQIQESDTLEYDCHRPSRNLDFDSVRKKAYGSLIDDIKDNMMCENCEYKREVNNCRKHNSNNKELMYDIMDEEDSTDNITIKEASENYFDYGSPYKRDNLDNGYNTRYRDDNDYNINNFETDDRYSYNIEENTNNISEVNTRKKKEVPPVKSKINLLSTLKKSAGDYTSDESSNKEKNLELTDDLFNIIDSMYEERNDK